MDEYYPSIDADPHLHIIGPKHTEGFVDDDGNHHQKGVYLIQFIHQETSQDYPAWHANNGRRVRVLFREAREYLRMFKARLIFGNGDRM